MIMSLRVVLSSRVSRGRRTGLWTVTCWLMEFFQSDKPTEIKIEFFWEEIGMRSSSIVVIRIMCRTVLYYMSSVKHSA